MSVSLHVLCSAIEQGSAKVKPRISPGLKMNYLLTVNIAIETTNIGLDSYSSNSREVVMSE